MLLSIVTDRTYTGILISYSASSIYHRVCAAGTPVSINVILIYLQSTFLILTIEGYLDIVTMILLYYR